MKVSGILAASAVTICLTASVAFAASGPSDLYRPGNAVYVLGTAHRDANMEQEKDPIQRLQARKEKIKVLLAQGKISKEVAEAKITLIDAKIKEIEEFNKLPLPEKKDKLINHFKTFMNDKVKEGKISREKADELITKYTERVRQWDGSGSPPRLEKGSKQHKHRKK